MTGGVLIGCASSRARVACAPSSCVAHAWAMSSFVLHRQNTKANVERHVACNVDRGFVEYLSRICRGFAEDLSRICRKDLREDLSEGFERGFE